MDDESGSDDIEDQMEKFRTQKNDNDIKKMKPPVHSSGKKRAISAKYQLKSHQKPGQKLHKKYDESTKSGVLAALKEENKNIGTSESEQRLKAETKKSRPFSNMSARGNKFISKTKKPQENVGAFDVDYKIDDTSSNTDLSRLESTNKTKSTSRSYPKGSHPSSEQGLRKTSIYKKIERLNDTQRQQLLFLIEQMESGQPVNKILSEQPLMSSMMPSTTGEMKNQTQEQPKISMMGVYNSDKHEIRIRVLSTWGHFQVWGLTEIEIFDDKGYKIELVPADIVIKNANKILCGTDRLINSTFLTCDDKYMWICSLPDYKRTLEIYLYYDKSTKLGAIRFWNYNKNILDSVKGIKEVEIITDGQNSWSGMINRGQGSDTIDYSTVVTLIPGVKIPEVIFDSKTTDYIDKQEPIYEDDFEDEKEVQSVKQQNRKFLEKIEEEKQATIDVKKTKDEGGPSWLKSKRPTAAKETDKIKSTRSRVPNIEGSGSKGGLSRRQAAQLESLEKPKTEKFSENKSRRQTQTKSTLTKHEEQKIKSRSLPAQNRKNKLADNKGIDSLEYFEITNLGRIGAQNKKEPLMKSEKKARGPIRALHNLDVDNETVFGTGKITNKDIVTNQPSKSSLLQGDILDQFQAQSNPKLTQNDSDEEFNIGAEIEAPKQQTFEDMVKDFEDQDFWIPKMPIGKNLVFSILSTWGDKHYVGLTGIEIFDNEGNLVPITATAPDVNLLPGITNDPRTADKLVDQHWFTKDDLHVWLSPYTPGQEVTIEIDLPKFTTISMIRIWNYNKNRIHSFRGVRLVKITLDDLPIFKGEIQKAPGFLSDPGAWCEVIMFTDEQGLMNRIDRNDWIKDIKLTDLEADEVIQKDEERPMTATKKFSEQDIKSLQDHLKRNAVPSFDDERPGTSAIIRPQKDTTAEPIVKRLDDSYRMPIKEKKRKNKQDSIKVKDLEINVLDTWGDIFYVGLNGIEILQNDFSPVKIEESWIDANPRDMNSIPGYTGDLRVLENLINGYNNSVVDKDIWLIPYTAGEDHVIKFKFPKPIEIKGIKLYNYNKSKEDSLRGARTVVIKSDGKLLTPRRGVIVKKATGKLIRDYDFGQFIPLPYTDGWNNKQIIPLKASIDPPHSVVHQEYETFNYPIGFVFKLNLYSTHGDFHYIGLNGIEMYDQNNKSLTSYDSNPENYPTIFGEPNSINDLDGVYDDIRTPDKLLDGYNDTDDDAHMWLAPYHNTRSVTDSSLRIPNSITISFEKPVCISYIKIYNYSKSSSRGVNEFDINVDDMLVYRGYMNKAGK